MKHKCNQLCPPYLWIKKKKKRRQQKHSKLAVAKENLNTASDSLQMAQNMTHGGAETEEWGSHTSVYVYNFCFVCYK